MRRREFIGLLAAAAVTRPPTSYAQQPAGPRLVGVLLGFAEGDRDAQSGLAALREELRKLGWTEGRNIEMEIHAAGGDVESIKRFANSWRLNQTSSLRVPRPLPRRCFSRHVPSR
jgi:putative ABC transport system substrate-binding protein